VGISAKYEWRRLKAQERAGQAMMGTAGILVPTVVIYMKGATWIPFAALGLCLGAAGWWIERRASARMRGTRPKFPSGHAE